MTFRTAFGPKKKVLKVCEDGRTKQSFKQECDVNFVIQRYKNTGVLPRLTALKAMYGDVTEVDFQRAQDVVLRAEDAFAQLPSKLRQRFKNDPAEFLAFVGDSRNVDELVDLGICSRREVAQHGAGSAPGGGGAVSAGSGASADRPGLGSPDGDLGRGKAPQSGPGLA